MRTLLLAATVAAATFSTAIVQAADNPPMNIFTSAQGVQQLIAKAKADRKPDQPLIAEPILELAPYRANLEYRTAKAPAAQHVKEAEMMYVIQGTGTIVTGGKLVNEKVTRPDNMSGTDIENGNAQALAPGDFLIVPQNTPHQITPSGGAPIILMTLHVPRTE